MGPEILIIGIPLLLLAIGGLAALSNSVADEGGGDATIGEGAAPRLDDYPALPQEPLTAAGFAHSDNAFYNSSYDDFMTPR